MGYTFYDSPSLMLTSESVTEGHPDKLCDQVSDAVLDSMLEQDPMSRVACEAAVAARLARAVGENEAQRMDEWLYTNQASMTPEMVVTALEDIAGVSGDTFAARYDDVLEDVKADILEGAALPVEATPTFVINGILLKGGLAPRFFDQAIAVELRLAASAP